MAKKSKKLFDEGLDMLNFWEEHYKSVGNTAKAQFYTDQKATTIVSKRGIGINTLSTRAEKKKIVIRPTPLTPEEKKARRLARRKSRNDNLEVYLHLTPVKIKGKKKKKPSPFDIQSILYWGYEQSKCNEDGLADFGEAFRQAMENYENPMGLPTTKSQVKQAIRAFNQEAKTWKKIGATQ